MSAKATRAKRRRALLVRRVFEGTLVLGTIHGCGSPPAPVDPDTQVCPADEVGVCAAPCPDGTEVQPDGTCAVAPVATAICPSGSEPSSGGGACVVPRVAASDPCPVGTPVTAGCQIATASPLACPSGTVPDLTLERCVTSGTCRAGGEYTGTTCVNPPLSISLCPLDSFLRADPMSGQCLAPVGSSGFSGFSGFSGINGCPSGIVDYFDEGGIAHSACLVVFDFVPVECPSDEAPDRWTSFGSGSLGTGCTVSGCDCVPRDFYTPPSGCGSGWMGPWRCTAPLGCYSGGTRVVQCDTLGTCTTKCDFGAGPFGPSCPNGSVEIDGACITPFATVCPSGSTEVSNECIVAATSAPQCPAGTEVAGDGCRAPPRACPAHTFPVDDGSCVAPSTACPPETYDTGASCVASCEGTTIATCVARWSRS